MADFKFGTVTITGLLNAVKGIVCGGYVSVAHYLKLGNYATSALPTLTTAEKGAVVYDTTVSGLKAWDGAAWQAVSGLAGLTITATELNLFDPTGRTSGTVPTSDGADGVTWGGPYLTSYTETDPNSLHTNGSNDMVGDIGFGSNEVYDIGSASNRIQDIHAKTLQVYGSTSGGVDRGIVLNTGGDIIGNITPFGTDFLVSAESTGSGVLHLTGNDHIILDSVNPIDIIQGPLNPSATTGANGAPPAQVASYLTINVNGTSYKIPLYNP